MNINTFSIVAYSEDEAAWGVAVASKFPAVGAVVPWARAGAGAVATQSYAKIGYGPDGLDLLEKGASASETLGSLLAADENTSVRQVAMVDAQGQVAAHTGSDCHDWAGHKTGNGFSVQGNLLAGEGVIEAMASAFVTSEGEMADRLVRALRAGEVAGGDRRGKQSAAVHVVRVNGGYGNDNDRYLDLRVDDAQEPVLALMDLVQLHHLYYQSAKTEDLLPIDDAIARELQTVLIAQGFMTGEINGVWDEVCQQVFWMLIGNENLEMRWTLEKNRHSIDRVVLEYLRKRYG